MRKHVHQCSQDCAGPVQLPQNLQTFDSSCEITYSHGTSPTSIQSPSPSS
uniref:Uncharacterized protein n=1 Tax=Arundo donax TaxID=35708 RepID=A0A0A8XQ25_ARUDO